MKKSTKFLIVVLFLLFVYFLMISIVLVGSAASSMLMCENTLKMIAKAIESYQNEWDGHWPPSLLELGPYYEGKYKPGPNNIPKCPGNRNEHETHDSSQYYYYPPKVDEVVPVCWDSNPHQIRAVVFSDTFVWNVLYSDGHVERLSERELFRELFRLVKTNPDVLKMLNYPDTRSYSKLTLFLVGIAIGLSFALLYRFFTRNNSSPFLTN